MSGLTVGSSMRNKLAGAAISGALMTMSPMAQGADMNATPHMEPSSAATPVVSGGAGPAVNSGSLKAISDARMQQRGINAGVAKAQPNAVKAAATPGQPGGAAATTGNMLGQNIYKQVTGGSGAYAQKGAQVGAKMAPSMKFGPSPGM